MLPLTLLFLVLLLTAIRARTRERGAHEGDAWLLGAGVFVALYLFAPMGLAGGSYVTPRLAVFPFVAAHRLTPGAGARADRERLALQLLESTAVR